MNRYGRNWIRPEKRRALYLRDGLACVYCGDSLEDGARLTQAAKALIAQRGGWTLCLSHYRGTV